MQGIGCHAADHADGGIFVGVGDVSIGRDQRRQRARQI
jgi:hypothetical protein